MAPHHDILIIGAGLSGIGAACHLARKSPHRSYLILEARAEIGGTWSLFNYPGIRSDSDMYTFGYSFKTWDDPKSFADAPAILSYLREAVEEYNVEEHIRYEQKVTAYDFDSSAKRWTVTTEKPNNGQAQSFTANFIFNCTGYYNYDSGYLPEFAGADRFGGQLIHPQHWPRDLSLSDKCVVVIGSGATAVTIVPAIADTTAHVTMLQRSPTYIGALPNEDAIARVLKRVLPKGLAHSAIRTKNILGNMLFFELCRRFPNFMRRFILRDVRKQLGPVPLEPHFTPSYKPWEQRFCLAPDGDLFRVLREGKASVVTDHIESFTPGGILLNSGELLPADIIIAATGLRLLAFGGAKIRIDGADYNLAEAFVYKGTMLSGLPNFFVFIGYSNASWTLKSDLTSEFITRVLRYMERHGYSTLMPQVIEPHLTRTRLMNLDSGYINRSADELPSQGDKAPWRMYQNFLLDYQMLRLDPVNDGRLAFAV